jgi:ribosome-associated toxin RatA of RatAB toxin-antitoxin module
MLSINFELSGMLKFAFGGVFSQIANTMVDSFSKRAKVVYGE